MNVFILSTGRCGSMTFARACQYIENFSSGHETQVDQLGPDRVRYPDQHIESDNRLAWFLGRIEKQYKDNAFYVHLHRDPQNVAKSYSTRQRKGMMMPAYAEGIYLFLSDEEKTRTQDIALDYVETVNTNIETFLKHQSNTMTICLDNAKKDFRKFWQRIEAEGNLSAALDEFDIKHNATENDVDDESLSSQVDT